MKERVKQIPARLLEFWNKYTSKQKTLIIGVICALVLAVAALVWFLNRPTYEKFQAFENVEDASAMAAALDESNIKYKTSNDGRTIYVEEDRFTDALYLMSDNKLLDTGYTWENAFDNSMSTTESEKSQKRKLALQNDLKKALVSFDNIKDAQVFIDQPESNYNILGEESQTSVSAKITLADADDEAMTVDMAEYLAQWLANAVGTDVENVSIIDNNMNNIYAGKASDTLGTALTTNGSQEFIERLRNTWASNTRQILLKYNYDDVEVATAGIQFNMDTVTQLRTSYDVAEGREYGYPSEVYNYKAEGSNAAQGIPGTDTNGDDTTYDILSNGGSNSSVTLDRLSDILTNQTVENITKEKGAVNAEDSTIGIVAIKYQVYNEEKMEESGQLDGTTFEEFMEANQERTPIEISEEEIELVAAATGIPAANIQLRGFIQPVFEAKEDSGATWTNYLMIILAVLIVALLVFVVFKGTAPVEITEMEPELSVEQLLATTKENQSLEDIEFSDGSETRRMIEKFVDENPEAVAQLLRNWLNEDWQ